MQELLTYISKYNLQQKELSSGDILFNEGDPCDKMGIVVKGELIISTITYNEKEETFNIIKEGEMFGDLLIFSNNPVYLGDVIAKRKTTVIIISKQKLISMLLNDEEFLHIYMSIICNKAVNIKKQAKLLSHKNIEDRILFYLKLKDPGNHIISFSTVTDFAQELSLPRPSVSRSLSKLEEKGYIIKNKHSITLK